MPGVAACCNSPCLWALCMLLALVAPAVSADAGNVEDDAVAMLQLNQRLKLQGDVTACTSNNGTQLKCKQDPTGRKVIHIVSFGRVGSCFFGSLLKKNGLPYLFEPDNHDGWGFWENGSISQNTRAHCLYTCDLCDGLIKNETTFQSLCGNVQQTIAMKTVGELSDIKIVHDEVPTAILSNTKLVVMLRDPRAMYHSMKKTHAEENKTWVWPLGETFLGHVNCSQHLMQFLSAKEFFYSVPNPEDHIRVVFFEHWSQDVENVVPDLFEWMGIPVSDAVHSKAVSSQKDSALEWLTGLAQEEIDMVQNAPYCQEFMQLAGYPLVVRDLADYSKLQEPFASAPTVEQAATLQLFRQDPSIIGN